MDRPEPLRIAIIASARHPIREPFAGGLEMHTHLLARRLRSRGHEVRVFASEDSDPDLGVEALCPVPLDLSDAARHDPAALADGFMREHHAYLHLLLRLSRERYDVIQNSSLHYLPPAMAEILTAPMVTTLHTPPTPWLESAVTVHPPAPDTRFVAVSSRTADQWRPRVAVERVIPNGIDLDMWRFQPLPGTTAVWTGRIVPEKGAHLALQAAHLAGLRIVLAGPVGDTAYFEQEILPLLDDRAVYMGHLPHRDLVDVVGGAGVLLCTPRWEEPYGLVVAEALSCGTPVAAFDRGAMSEIIDERSGRLARPDDTAALAAAALEALQLDRRDCRRRAEEHCSAQVMVDRYEQLYLEVAGRTAAGHG